MKKRAVVIAAAVLLGPLVFYLLVANLFLATPLLTKLTNRSPDTFIMRYDFAYTLWPGHAHVRGFHMVFQSYRVAFELDLEAATTDIVLTDLLERRFRTQKVRARGVAYRQLLREPPAEYLTPRVQAFPLVAGAAPVVVGPPPDEAPPDAKVWSVRLDDVDVRIREVWIHEYRWRGSGRAVGAFEIIPNERFWVGPARAELEPGLLTVGADVVSTNFGGAGTCTIEPVDIVRQKKLRMLRELSVDGHFEGDVEGLKFLRAYGLSASGAGRLVLDPHLADGRVTEALELSLELPKATVRHPRTGAGFSGSASFRAFRGERLPRLRVQASGDAFIPLGDDTAITFEVQRTEADVVLASSDFTKVPRLAWYRVRAPRLEAEDTVPLRAALKGRVPFFVPALLGSGPLTAREVHARSSPRGVRLKVGHARMGETQVRGEVTVGGGKPTGAFEAKIRSLPIGVALDEGKASFQLLARPGWLEAHLEDEREADDAGAGSPRGEDDGAGRAAPARDAGGVPSR